VSRKRLCGMPLLRPSRDWRAGATFSHAILSDACHSNGLADAGLIGAVDPSSVAASTGLTLNN